MLLKGFAEPLQHQQKALRVERGYGMLLQRLCKTLYARTLALGRNGVKEWEMIDHDQLLF